MLNSVGTGRNRKTLHFDLNLPHTQQKGKRSEKVFINSDVILLKWFTVMDKLNYIGMQAFSSSLSKVAIFIPGGAALNSCEQNHQRKHFLQTLGKKNNNQVLLCSKRIVAFGISDLFLVFCVSFVSCLVCLVFFLSFKTYLNQLVHSGYHLMLLRGVTRGCIYQCRVNQCSPCVGVLRGNFR